MGAAGRLMRLTGSNSPERMLTDQFDSRSESTRTSHSFPSHVALAMAPVLSEGRLASVREGADGSAARSYLLRDARSVGLDPERGHQAEHHHREGDEEEPAVVFASLLAHRADAGKLPGGDPAGLSLAAHEIVGGDDPRPVELQELLLRADGQLASRMAHVELHGSQQWRRLACFASSRSDG